MKYLKKFENETEYNAYMSGDEVFLPNVSLIGTGTADVRYKQVPPIISAGMICYADSSNNLKFCSVGEWDSTLGTAQGVVVVPSNHTPDGTARIMCIKGITSAGTESLSDVNMKWSNVTVDTGLPNMNKVPTWSNTIGGTIGNNIEGKLPSDNPSFTGSTDCISNSLKYYDTSGPFIPSPYLEDGSQNPAYINTVEATTGNCLSDFDGKSNTAVLVGLGSDYIAANACNLYGTTALPAGNWYLPSGGELGYIIPRFSVIQSALNAVGGVQLISYNIYWSSTERNNYNVCSVAEGGGNVLNMFKTNSYYVRAFASVPVSPIGF